jgi:hypothetical protein
VPSRSTTIPDGTKDNDVDTADADTSDVDDDDDFTVGVVDNAVGVGGDVTFAAPVVV